MRQPWLTGWALSNILYICDTKNSSLELERFSENQLYLYIVSELKQTRLGGDVFAYTIQSI